MNKLVQQLREALAFNKKEARNLLESKGSTTWTKEDQEKFDNLSDEMSRIESQIDAHQRLLDDEAEKHFNDATQQKREKNTSQEGYELFLRKSMRNMSATEMALISNVMSTTPDADGGFTIETTEVAGAVIETLKAYGTMRKVASQITTSRGEKMSWPTTDGTNEEGEIVAENQTSGSQDITFGSRSLEVFKFSSKIITVSMELLQDTSVDIVSLIHRRIGERIGRIHDRMFTVGTGTAQPMGLYTAAKVGKVGATGLSDTVNYDSLVDLVESLDPAYLDNDSGFGWMFNQTVRTLVRKLKDDNGRPIWTPSYDAGITQKTPDLLLGYPVNLNNKAPAPAANAKSIAFGKLSAYLIRDAMNIQIYRFDDSAFVTKGQVGFMAFCRAGGNLMDLDAVKTFQHSAT